MKKILLGLVLTIVCYGAEVATKEDVKLIREDMKVIRDDMKVIREDMKVYMQQVDKRFEQVDKRFEDMKHYSDKRFEEMNNKFYMLLTALVAGFTITMGYLLKERNFIIKNVKTEIEPELLKKADKSLLEKVIVVIEEMAKNNKEVEDILAKHHLRLA